MFLKKCMSKESSLFFSFSYFVRVCVDDPSIYNSSNLCVCLWPLFLDNHWSDLIETCQVYCWGPEDVPFQGFKLIGQVVPKLWPFIYQTNDRTRCCVGVADGERAPFSYQWQDTLLRRRGCWGRDPQPRSPLRVTTYRLPDSDDLLYSNNFSISYAHL